MASSQLLLDAGSGGLASQRLIHDYFQKYFGNSILDVMDDAALLKDLTGVLAISTDSYTVTPLFFPGGSIGTLAVHGTVNDVAMLGATPKYISCAFILEEGLDLEILENVVRDMGDACRKAKVQIVTGDTKVVPKGACDHLFINTTGVGEISVPTPPSGHNAKPGDAILISGSVGDHGLTIMASRDGLNFLSDVKSDSAPLNDLTHILLNKVEVHVLRDPTRGGLATTLNEIALQSNVGIELWESQIPVHASVQSGCAFLGLDPLYLANEGKCICIVPKEAKDMAQTLLRSHPLGQEASIIGEVTNEHLGKVFLKTAIGGSRILGMLEGAQLPRIC